MTHYYQFFISSDSTIDEAREEAKSLNLTDTLLIEEQDPNRVILGGFANKLLTKSMQHLIPYTHSQEVNWQEQAALFSPYFNNGYIHIPLSDFSCSNEWIYLRPGAGFGDLSHPTTQLCMHLIDEYVEARAVLDIGCGNGILSFASKALKADHVCGIDIDSEALHHSSCNQALNRQLDVEFSTQPSSTLESYSSWVALMNMTFLEQKEAWSSLNKWHENISTLITSGILSEQKDQYLLWASENSWQIIKILEKNGWCAFVFKK
jgi:ribosomal protein L11 methyltransferase